MQSKKIKLTVIKCLKVGYKKYTYVLHISVKLANDVFLVPIRTTCGGRMTNFCFLPATISGFFSRIISNTLIKSSSYV